MLQKKEIVLYQRTDKVSGETTYEIRQLLNLPGLSIGHILTIKAFKKFAIDSVADSIDVIVR